MIRINENYTKLKASYLFSDIAKRVSAYVAANPTKPVIRLGIGDVTEPLPEAVRSAMHKAVDELGARETFRGYGPEQGYDFLRGAIALAVNGIPIFNPQNNRGEISADIGELDRWGGHCGRADDYHYHAAPLHLQETLGKTLPIAYALDGYAIYGLTEPDGTTPKGLDTFNGHATPALGYHYHASTRYPFINGGFHGEVVEAEGQVDPQPRAQSVRPALQALRGAEITGFTTGASGQGSRLTYAAGGKSGSIDFTPVQGGGWKFTFVDPDGSKREETYRGDDREGKRPAWKIGRASCRERVLRLV